MTKDKSKVLLATLKKKKKAGLVSYNRLAKKMNYKTHSTISSWVLKKSIPVHAQVKLTKLLAGAK